MNVNITNWSRRIDDALWAYNIVYGKACHLSDELEHKAIWSMKRVKLDLTEVAEQILNGFNDVDEFCLKSYECLAIYKEKMKKYHDQSIEMQEYTVGKLCTSIKLKATPLSKKLKSKLKAPFLITKVFPHG